MKFQMPKQSLMQIQKNGILWEMQTFLNMIRLDVSYITVITR